MLCAKCNYEKKQASKKAAGKSTAKYSFKTKATGQAEIFAEIAEEREWVCFVTGEVLRELTPTQFMHVLPKALNKFPKFILYKKNIVLATNEVHFKWDHTPRSECIKDPRFDKLFALEAELKQQYPNIL